MFLDCLAVVHRSVSTVEVVAAVVSLSDLYYRPYPNRLLGVVCLPAAGPAASVGETALRTRLLLVQGLDSSPFLLV